MKWYLNGNPFLNYDWRNDYGSREAFKKELRENITDSQSVEKLKEIENYEARLTKRLSEK